MATTALAPSKGKEDDSQTAKGIATVAEKNKRNVRARVVGGYIRE